MSGFRTIYGSLTEQEQEIVSEAKKQLADLQRRYQREAEPFMRIITDIEARRPIIAFIPDGDKNDPLQGVKL